MNLPQIITRQIKAMGARLTELSGVDTGDESARSYKQSELAQERSRLRNYIGDAERRRARLQDRETLSAIREREARFAELEIANRTETARRFSEKLELQGDHRQARIWREQILSIPEDVYREYGLVHQ